MSLHSYQKQGWFAVRRWSAVPPSYQRSCSFWKEKLKTILNKTGTKDLKNSWVGPFVCSLVITYIGIKPSSPVSLWASSWKDGYLFCVFNLYFFFFGICMFCRFEPVSWVSSLFVSGRGFYHWAAQYCTYLDKYSC